MFGTFVSLALLGLSAVDPVGIAAMPILLLQKNPFVRSFVFLAGSFTSLMIMGFLFAEGLGTVVLKFDNTHSWFVPSLEVFAGLALIAVAATLFWRLKRQQVSVEPSDIMLKRLQLGKGKLFLFGALLVAIQSMIDVVFVVAMIHIGQLNLSTPTLLLALATYATAALVLQLAVVVAYKLTPTKQRSHTLDKVHGLLTNYANQAVIAVSFLLGCLLLVIAVLGA
jgi:hypothetical protein